MSKFIATVAATAALFTVSFAHATAPAGPTPSCCKAGCCDKPCCAGECKCPDCAVCCGGCCK